MKKIILLITFFFSSPTIASESWDISYTYEGKTQTALLVFTGYNFTTDKFEV